MSRTTKRLGKVARTIAGKAERAVAKAGKKAKGSGKPGKAVRRMVESGAVALAGLAAEQTARAMRARRTGAPSPALAEFELPLPLDQAVERVAEGLRSEGFGILTRIDVQATLREKLGASFRPYLILGACNPALAHRALAANAETGLALPCNVTVEETPEHTTLVRIVDPEAMLVGLGKDPGLREIAVEARQRLSRAAEAARAHAAAVVL